MEEKFLSFDTAKVQTLTLDQLARTQLEKDVYGNPLRGIYHFALINQILDLCKEQGYNTEVYDLFAAQNKERQTPGVVLIPELEKQYGERATEAHLLRRVFANIRITDFDDDAHTTCLAVAFHQKGIQVGFGNNVKICHNQCMLGHEQYIATYSEGGNGRRAKEDRIEIPQVLDAVKSWLLDARHIIVTEREKIERMKNIEVSADQMFRLIGLLTAIRVKNDTGCKEIQDRRTYPLNQAQISQFTEAMILHYHRTQHISVWDVYNAATELYKASSMEIPALLPQNRSMVSFLEDQFQLV